MKPRIIPGWTYIFTSSKYGLDIYGCGYWRIGIDRATGKQDIGYMGKHEIKEVDNG